MIHWKQQLYQAFVGYGIASFVCDMLNALWPKVFKGGRR